MLTAQLRKSEADGAVNRKVYAQLPLNVEYTPYCSLAIARAD
jgi:DNA-binding HxlR family transcriptional regulator